MKIKHKNVLIKQTEEELVDLYMDLEDEILDRSILQSDMDTFTLTMSGGKNVYEQCNICGTEFHIGSKTSWTTNAGHRILAFDLWLVLVCICWYRWNAAPAFLLPV